MGEVQRGPWRKRPRQQIPAIIMLLQASVEFGFSFFSISQSTGNVEYGWFIQSIDKIRSLKNDKTLI